MPGEPGARAPVAADSAAAPARSLLGRWGASLSGGSIRAARPGSPRARTTTRPRATWSSCALRSGGLIVAADAERHGLRIGDGRRLHLIDLVEQLRELLLGQIAEPAGAESSLRCDDVVTGRRWRRRDLRWSRGG